MEFTVRIGCVVNYSGLKYRDYINPLVSFLWPFTFLQVATVGLYMHDLGVRLSAAVVLNLDSRGLAVSARSQNRNSAVHCCGGSLRLQWLCSLHW